MVDWQPSGPLIFRSNCDKDHPPRPYMGGALPVWSETLLRTFRGLGIDNIQAFPATIVTEDAAVSWTNYFAINVIGLVDAADLSASTYTKIDTAASGVPRLRFTKLVIDLAKAADLPLFRLAHSPLTLVLQARLVDALRAIPMPGGWGMAFDELGT
ncbi:imm11 family protein [Luteitalea pratensis]|nr:DUF1629 domain-containing protein [Luteitalea pratensis]